MLTGFRCSLSMALGCLLVSGCALSTRQEDRFFAELQNANARAAESQAKVDALEARLAHIEAQATASSDAGRASSAHEADVVDRLDELITLNHEVLARQLASSATLERASPGEPARASRGGCDEGVSQEEQLRRLVVRLHGNSSGFRGGLSRDQAEALHVLLRRERVLDVANPWHSW